QTKKRKKRRESTSPLESGTWPLRFEALKAFRASFGHCRVPQRYKADPMLGVWVGHLRTRKRQGKLNPLKVELLNSIGFEWEVRKNRWEEKYEQLVQFKERFGHCRVPIGWEENPALANWTHEMRRKRKRGSLSPELEAKLQQLDFEWQLMEQSTWDDGFEELKRYKEKFHTCCVPRNYGKDFKLGHWVHNMRYKYKKGTLKPEQIALLESLGFQWSVRKQKELQVEEPPIIEPALENEATPTTEQTSTSMPTSHSPPLPPSSPLHHLTSPPLSSSQLSFSNLQQQQHHAFLSSDNLTDTTDPSSSHMSLFETSLPEPPLSHPEQQQAAAQCAAEAAGEDGGLHRLQLAHRTAPCDFMQATEGDNLPGHHHAQEYDEMELRPDAESVEVTQE
ncbi:Helicase C-terminal domain-containing protein, partial [Balamuthia mandrillaris]